MHLVQTCERRGEWEGGAGALRLKKRPDRGADLFV